MERHQGASVAEPTFDPAQAADLSFRSRRGGSSPVARTNDAIDSLWWQIALGGFLALTAHSIVTGLYQRWEVHQAMQQLYEEARKLSSEAGRRVQPASPTSFYQQQAPEPLRDGERCINGRRFARVENGWLQINEDCQ